MLMDVEECPRCHAPFAEPKARFGPCESCVVELRAKFAGAARDDVEDAGNFVGHMNVTPNFVATKD